MSLCGCSAWVARLAMTDRANVRRGVVQLFSCALMLWVCGAVGAAHAERRPSLLPDHAADAPPGVIELDVGFYQDGDLLGVPFSLGGAYRVSDQAELELEWPLAFADGGPVSSFRSGNPFAALYYFDRLSGGGYVRVGGGLGLPVASVDTGNLTDALDDALPLGVAGGTEGMWDLWLYSPNRVSLAIPLQVEHKSGKLLVGTDVAVGVLFTTDKQVNPDHDVVVQLAGLIGAAFQDAQLGVKLQTVVFATSNAADKAQLALVPFVQGQINRSSLLYARFVMNLDKPLGVFGDSDSFYWGLHVGGGGRF